MDSTPTAGKSIDATASYFERILNPAAILRYRNDYLRLTSTLTYSYLLVLPLLLLYEAGAVIVERAGVALTADSWIKSFLSSIGLSNTISLAILLLLIGVGVVWYERRHGIPIRLRYVPLMALESIGYGIVLGMIVGSIVGGIVGYHIGPALQVPGDGGGSLFMGLVLSLGAGIYEEVVFRLILVTLLFALLSLIFRKENIRYLVAAVIGALIFSAVHYTGSRGDELELGSFLFRFLMGLALNGLMLVRGFGITAAAHAFYDVFVTLQT